MISTGDMSGFSRFGQSAWVNDGRLELVQQRTLSVEQFTQLLSSFERNHLEGGWGPALQWCEVGC